MVNRQMLVFEVAIGSKTMIQSTGKIRPILEVKDHFTVVSVVCEVSFASRFYLQFSVSVKKGAKTSSRVFSGFEIARGSSSKWSISNQVVVS